MKEKSKKVCMFVLNPCTNDARVLKEAATLGEAGYDVKVIAIISKDAPQFEEKKKSFTIYRVQPRSFLFYVNKIAQRSRRDSAAAPVTNSNSKKNGLAESDQISPKRYNNFWRIVKNRIREFLRKFHQGKTYISYWLKAKKLAVSLKADIYHAHDLNTLIPAYWAAKKTHAKTVYDSHELFTEIQTWGRVERYFYKKLEAFIIKRVDKVITINNSIAGELMKRYHIEYPKVIVNCPPPLKRGVSNAYDSVLRNAAGIARDKRLVLYQGGFTQYRGLEELIEAFTHLDESFCLVFMGYGKIRDELEVLVYSKGLNNSIKFLPAVPQEELLKYTSSADLGVIPYKPVSLNNYYTLPNKLFEYINAGIPIIASDLPELRRIIKEYDIGYLFDPYKSESIADAIKYVFSDKKRYDTIKANTTKAASEYNWNNESKKLLECYRLL